MGERREELRSSLFFFPSSLLSPLSSYGFRTSSPVEVTLAPVVGKSRALNESTNRAARRDASSTTTPAILCIVGRSWACSTRPRVMSVHATALRFSGSTTLNVPYVTRLPSE